MNKYEKHAVVLLKPDWFGDPLLVIENVEVPSNFSFDDRVSSNKEYKYKNISIYMRDDNFEKMFLSGLADFVIVPTLKHMTNLELIGAVKLQNALATVAVLHIELQKNKHFLDQVSGSEIMIPAPIKAHDVIHKSVRASLNEFYGDHRWSSSLLTHGCDKGKCIGLLVFKS